MSWSIFKNDFPSAKSQNVKEIANPKATGKVRTKITSLNFELKKIFPLLRRQGTGISLENQAPRDNPCH
jgi:hypothetical protein